MPGPYAVRVKTPAGWQDLTIVGPPGPRGEPGYLDVSLVTQPRVNGATWALNTSDGWRLFQYASQYAHVISKSDGISDDFTLDANKYAWTALKAGIYTIIASVGTADGMTAPNAGSLSVRICVKSGGVPVSTDYLVEETNATDAAGRALITQVACTQKLYAGDQVAIFAKAEGFATTPLPGCSIRFFSIAKGGTGPEGKGVPAGGTTGQALVKKSATDYDTQWAAGGSGGGGHIIQEESTSLAQRSKLDFQGAGVTASDDPANDKTIVTVTSAVPLDPWHKVGTAGEPAFLNNWVAYDSDVYYRKDPLGRVWLRGSINGGLTGTAAFTLPVGYRPVLAGLTRVRTIGLQNQIAAGQWESQVSVHPDGNVIPYTITPTGQAYISLDQIDFDSGTVTSMPTGPQGPKGDPGVTASSPYVQCGFGTSAVMPAGTSLLPIGAIVNISDAADFTRNANGTMTVNKTGTYVVSTGANCGTQLAANSRVQFQLEVNGGAVTYQSAHDPWAQASLSWTGKLAAGDVVRISAYTDRATDSLGVTSFGISAVTGPKGDTGGNATVAMDPWHTVGAAGEPPFLGTWAAFGSVYQVPQFRKDPLGKVWIRGLVKAGALATAIFTLPVGYRPPAETGWNPVANSGSTNIEGEVRVQPTGAVVLINANVVAGYAWIDGQFDTDTVTAMPTGPQGPAGPGVRGLVTALPSNPQDGDECYFQSAAMALDGIIWHLRYRAASASAYKWEYLGGSTWQIDTGMGTVPLGTNSAIGPTTLTLPLNGDYRVEHGGRMYNNGSPPYGNMSARLQLFRAAAVAVTDIAVIDFWTVASTGLANVSITPHLVKAARLNGAVAGDVLRQAAGAVGSVGIMDHAWMHATPIRAG
jgi:hypothetical protein